MNKQKSAKKVIIVTGTPATGKTVIAKKLSLLLKFKYIDVNKLIIKNKLYSSYDKVRNTKIVPIRPLLANLKQIIAKSENSVIIDSHLSHFLSDRLVDLCIVTKCSLKKLKKRLEKRYQSKKVRENLDAEIFDVCLFEAQENSHEIFVINTSKKLNFSNIVIKIKRKLFQ